MSLTRFKIAIASFICLSPVLSAGLASATETSRMDAEVRLQPFAIPTANSLSAAPVNTTESVRPHPDNEPLNLEFSAHEFAEIASEPNSAAPEDQNSEPERALDAAIESPPSTLPDREPRLLSYPIVNQLTQLVTEQPSDPAIAATQTAVSANQATDADPPSQTVERQRSSVLGQPDIRLQGVYKLEGDESSARARVTTLYPVTPNLLLGGTVDLTAGEGFADSPETGLRLSELYVAASLPSLPTLRVVAGLMDLTSYFDRNSFAKDGASQFFNRAFQTNPALSAAGLSTRVGVLLHWDVTDDVQLKAATFSADRSLSEFALNSLAAEIGVRLGTVILRGTYVSSKDAGQNTGFEEIYSLPRNRSDEFAPEFGLKSDDRETAYGINVETYLPQLKLGLFGRYGWYDNKALDTGGQTYSVGITRPNLFTLRDRLGVAYGRQLSNNDLRQRNDDKIPDVFEVYYDLPIFQTLRLGITAQARNQFSETIFGFRLKTELDLSPRRKF